MKINSKEALLQALNQFAYEFGIRVITGDNIAHGATGFSLDNKAFIDAKINGLIKLNCFFEVSQQDYNWVKGSQWAPALNKRVDKPAKKGTKGAKGCVLQEGNPTPLGLSILKNWGTNLISEKYEIAMYENELYKPVLINLEFKLMSTTLNRFGYPVESIVMNAHISTKLQN